MNNQRRAAIGLESGRRQTLRAAIRCALVEQCSALRVSAGLVALGLAAQPVLAAPFPAEFELSSLQTANGGNGSVGVVLNGIDAGDSTSNSVSTAGDVNGDGIDDLIIGAHRADPGGRDYAGESYVVFGRAQTGFPAEIELSGLLEANGGDGSAGFILNGIDAYDTLGYSVSAAGDVNGDGIDDLLVGALLADPGGRDDAGESYVVFGRDQAAGGFSAEFELSSLVAGDGSEGFVLNGIDAGDYAGFSVSAAGDVNGDGIDDVLVGAPDADPGGRDYAGESYVVFGRAQTAFPAELELSSLLQANGGDGSTGFVLNGIDVGDFTGNSVSAAGDVNGDGIDDLVVNAPTADPGGREYAGESYLVFGRDQAAGGFPAELELSSLAAGDGSAGFVLNGIDAYDYSGFRTSAAGDVNGDGIDDLLVSGDSADPGGRVDAGESYVVFGRDQRAGGFPGEFELSSLAAGDGSAGFVLNGINAHDLSGVSVSAAGDLNGDGIADLAVGAFRADPGGRDYAGESYVVYGRFQTGFPAELELSSLLPSNGGDGSAGFVLNGIDAKDYLGKSVRTAGDVNGDGIGDLLVGAAESDVVNPDVRDGTGEAYIVFGHAADRVFCDGFVATIVGIEADDTIEGTSAPDVIQALGGNDTVRGMGGNDTICGGDGHDMIFAGAQDDRLFGGRGNDRLFGLGGHDEIRGGNGDDDLFGQAGNDHLFGDAGADRLFGGDGNDRLFGGLDMDRLFGQAGNDTLNGGAAADRCNGGGGNDDMAASCEVVREVP